jgi:hypothetical protein
MVYRENHLNRTALYLGKYKYNVFGYIAYSHLEIASDNSLPTSLRTRATPPPPPSSLPPPKETAEKPMRAAKDGDDKDLVALLFWRSASVRGVAASSGERGFLAAGDCL